MNREGGPVHLRGTCAAPGLALGPLVQLGMATPGSGHAPLAPFESPLGAGEPIRAGGDARAGAAAGAAQLRSAIEVACAELALLMGRPHENDAKALIAFQIAMLEDPVVSDPAFAAIARGVPPKQAWRESLALQIDPYDSAEDEYFRGRAVDLRDLRDRVARLLSGAAVVRLPPGSIVVAADLTPSQFLETVWAEGGIALTGGSANSHVAMLARARGVPMLIGLDPAARDHRGQALLDADNGLLIASPDPGTSADFARRRRTSQSGRGLVPTAPAVTADGERVLVMINVADATDLHELDPANCDGIGLLRTELLFRELADLEDEERQFTAYARILEWAAGRPVTARLVDAGGDKPIAGYSVVGEANPFLGLRGVRLALRQPRLLEIQLRALARAAVLGPLEILVPMVTVPTEMRQVRDALDRAVAALMAAGVASARPRLGMMIEVPAAALTCDAFAADFFSIGSNDLLQYVTASSRDSLPLAALQNPMQEAMLRIMRQVLESAKLHGVPVSLCGDMASDPACVAGLLELGLRCLSVAPPALPLVKAAISGWRRG